MSEEKKEQDDFLSGHAELLNSINKKPAEEAGEAPPAAETEQTAEETVEPVKKDAVAEETHEKLPVAEEDLEEVAEEDQKAVEPEPVAAPEPVIKEEPVAVVEEAKPEPAPKPKKKKQHKQKTARTEEEKKRHEEMLKHQAMEDAEVKEVLGFFQKYAKPAGAFIIICCVLFMGDRLIKNMRANKVATADELLSKAKTAEDFQEIVDQYGKTPSGPLAMMGLAQQKFNSGDLAGAEAAYADFVKKYPKHDMAELAEFNIITCKEAQGQLGEASILYGDFKNKHEDSYLAPKALLSKARCFEALDNFAEAKLVYEDIITFYPETGWAQMAESKLAVVERKLQ